MTMLPKGWRVEGDALHIGAYAAEALVERFGSPLYVYDAAVMRERLTALRDATRGFADIYYSAKANPNVSVLRIFVEAGAGVEIASAAEYERARAAGAAASAILFSGPGKTDHELEHVIRSGLGELHLESMTEIERAAAIAQRLGQRQAVSLRVNPVAAAQGGAMRMGGQPAAFGIDEEHCFGAVDAIMRHPSLDLGGVHMFAGTQILDADALRRQWAHGLALARAIAAHARIKLRTIDLGGGLGVPYFTNQRPLDLGAVTEASRDLAELKRGDPLIAAAQVLLEPGRFLVAESGAYLARVTDVKMSRGKRFVILDGGMHHHLAASGNLGQAIKRDFPVVPANRMARQPLSPAVLSGPLGTPLDMLARQAQMPQLDPGDLVAVLKSGAYGLSASPVGFLSHPMPAEILIDGEAIREIRARGSFAQPITPLP